jgi:hypothetical protein
MDQASEEPRRDPARRQPDPRLSGCRLTCLPAPAAPHVRPPTEAGPVHCRSHPVARHAGSRA